MELKRAEFVTPENRELLPPGVAPIERYVECANGCGEPVDLLEGPSASIAAWTGVEGDRKPDWSQFKAQHPNCIPRNAEG